MINLFLALVLSAPPPEVCTTQFASGLANVECYGADGADSEDDTTAIRAALAAAGLTRAVYFPAGLYLTSEPINIQWRRLIGEQQTNRVGLVPERVSMIRYIGPETSTKEACAFVYPPPAFDAQCTVSTYQQASVLHASNGPATLDRIWVDANRRAAIALHMYKVSGAISQLRFVQTTGAREVALFLEQSSVHVFAGSANNSKDGMVLTGSNGARHIGTQYRYNDRHGAVLTDRINEPGSGGYQLDSVNPEGNGGNGMLVIGVSRVWITDAWLEGNGLQGADSFRAEDSDVIRIEGSSVHCPPPGDPDQDGNPTYYAIRLKDCRGCKVFDNATCTSDHTPPGCYKIKLENSRYSEVRGNVYNSGTGARYYLGGGHYHGTLVDALFCFDQVRTDRYGVPWNCQTTKPDWM